MNEVRVVVPQSEGLARPETILLKRQKLAACRDNVPSVHGRPSNPSLNVKTRLSNHQRNLSLDFRYVFIGNNFTVCMSSTTYFIRISKPCLLTVF